MMQKKRIRWMKIIIWRSWKLRKTTSMLRMKKKKQLKNSMKKTRQITRWLVLLIVFLIIANWIHTRIVQSIHHIVVKMLYDISEETWYENDDNFLWENVKNNFMNLIFLTRKRLNDIENDEKMSLDAISDEKQYKQNWMMLSKLRITLKMTRFQTIQRMWLRLINILKRKLRHLRECDMSCRKCRVLQKISFLKLFLIIFLIVFLL